MYSNAKLIWLNTNKHPDAVDDGGVRGLFIELVIDFAIPPSATGYSQVFDPDYHDGGAISQPFHA